LDRPGPERRRGQIWWARVDKRRPILLLSRPEAYAVRRRAIAAEVTTTIRLNPATVSLSRRDGLPEPCIANCDNLVTVNQDDLLEYVTTLSPERMTEVDGAVRFALGLER
jgi:mRNA interferase MazF